MFSKSSYLYDKVYSLYKNYEQESNKISELLAEIHPNAKNLLDVACGTGEHAKHLIEKHNYNIDGIDIEPDMIAIAKQKNKQGNFYINNMQNFNLGRTYDAILCLFSSIGYVRTLDNVKLVLTQFQNHLKEDGILVLEPWFAPDKFYEGRYFFKTYEDENIKVVRMSHTKVKDRISYLDFQYLIGTKEGIIHKTEKHELGLFTIEEMIDCFKSTGFEVKYNHIGLTEDRGLYIARKA